MRFRATPLVEASLVSAITWLLALLFSVLTSSFNFTLALATAMAIAQIYLLISFSIWAVLGHLVKARASAIRLLANLSATSVIAVGGTLLLLSLTQQQIGANPGEFSVEDAGIAQAKVVSFGIIYFVAALVAGLVTYLFATAPKRQG